jgi:hypothetical protein
MRRIGLDIIRTRFAFDERQRLVTQVDDDVRLGADLEQVTGESFEKIGELLPAVVERLIEANATLSDWDHRVGGDIEVEAVGHEPADHLGALGG